MSSKKSGGNSGGRPVSPSNRKYIGSKRELASLITKRIFETSGQPEVFFDAFLGTGAVSTACLEQGVRKIIACDNLFSNTVVFSGSFPLAADDQTAFREALEELNRLPGHNGYITEHFADTYFTRANCRRMDAVREAIARKERDRSVTAETTAALLASFLLSVDRAANTLGQYDAFLKNLGQPGMTDGRHVVDVRVYEDFVLRPLQCLKAVEHEIYTEDILAVADRVRADTAYLDPPYNSRQYCDNYHLLENLALWKKPAVAGKTKKFDRRNLKSPFSMRKKAGPALALLIDRLKAEHVYLSYNSEGILSKTDITSLLDSFGKVKLWEIPYPVFGKGAGVARKRLVTEYLFYLRKRNRPRDCQDETDR
jgi:adenine-specific DNA-methyltransferase